VALGSQAVLGSSCNATGAPESEIDIPQLPPASFLSQFRAAFTTSASELRHLGFRAPDRETGGGASEPRLVETVQLEALELAISRLQCVSNVVPEV